MRKMESAISVVFVSVFAQVSFASTPAPVPASSKAKITCEFAIDWYPKWTFEIDLEKKSIKENETNSWHIREHFQKAYPASHLAASRNIKKFEMGVDQPIRTLVLDGDNQDDTDYLLNISYKPYWSSSAKQPLKLEAPAVFASFTFFPDSDLENPTVYPSKKCSMELLK